MKISGKYLTLIVASLMLVSCGGNSDSSKVQPPRSSSVSSALSVVSSSSSTADGSAISSQSDISSSSNVSSQLSSSSQPSSSSQLSSSSQPSSSSQFSASSLSSSSLSNSSSSQKSSSSVRSSSSKSSSSIKSSSSSSSSRISSSSQVSSSSATSSSESSSESFSSSSRLSSSSSITSLANPQDLFVAVGNKSVNLQWSPVQGAATYHLYYATEPNINVLNYAAYEGGTWIPDVNTPYTVTGLSNNKTYYFVVTAANANTESSSSGEVSATPRVPSVVNSPSAQEVLVVELINRARLDPQAEAQRFNIGLNDGGVSISPTPKPPLAHNMALIGAARGHSQWMLDNNIFDHVGVNNTTPTQRMQAAGYSFTGNWASGENIAWKGTPGSTIDMTAMAIDHHEALFKSAYHRVNILNASYRELGVGQLQGMYRYTNNQNYLSSMITQNFARSGNAYFLTGVVYQDANNDNFYTVGEGLSGMTITVDGAAYNVLSTGAYTIPLTSGAYTATLTGAGLAEPQEQLIEITNANRKLDFIKHGANIDISYW